MKIQNKQSALNHFKNKFIHNINFIFTGFLAGGFLGSAYEPITGTLVGMLFGGYLGYSSQGRG